MSDTLYKTAKATVPNITEAKEKNKAFHFQECYP